MRCKSLHSLPKSASKTQKIQEGYGQYVSVLFIIPIMIDVHGHRFEIFTLVSESNEKLDLVLGIENIFELEGVIHSRESYFSFLNRSKPCFPKDQVILKLREQQFIKIEAPFIDEILGLAIVKMLDKKAQRTLMLKLEFVQNLVTLDVTNSFLEIVIRNRKEMLGILDMRWIAYYKINQWILLQNHSKYYRYE